MLPTTGPRGPLFGLAVSAGLVLLFVFGFLAWQSPPQMPQRLKSTTHVEMTVTNEGAAKLGIHEIIRQLYQPLKIAPDESSFSFIGEDLNLTSLALPWAPRYKKPMGKDILILDLETRPLESTEHFNHGLFDWRKLNHVSGGVFSHYIYSLIHGYDYKFVRAHEFEDRHATWIKPSALAQHIKNYKFIVFLDADATFRFQHLPLEWMFNYWQIKPQHSFTMALDPWDPEEPQYNSDRFNRTYTNTGFMVVQNNAHTMQILKDWHECPDDTRYKGCSEWKMPKFHEQSAFGEYIRYDYADYVKELQCAEANGFPGVEISNCQGKYVRHYWFEKQKIKEDLQQNMMNAITLPIQRIFAENIGGIITEQKENVLPS
ncbi:hypothetical protein P171DRAFT_369640 [Karstenula rhodostoma CBS 690.94]|uniref:Nucleotide-diphospho-sugar transferase domain-containing protein n=1 Tax=Karstenula rhodostoma CBS 690.94 TaxID=1392251 RepID=A0A9P4P6Q0_9PLEO|nr:hypothetical protein P171DRAFT_369640 [Karstenula rhodostoma CBS 690.94]